MAFDIRENLKKLPESPGVYMHKDDTGRILYVGKAINLKRRVSQYFRPPNQLDAKTRAMVSHVASFEYIRVGSELEALILENNLIKKYQPHYNIDLRDDKTYPYLKVTVKEEWPRLLKTRRVESDGSRYFGPYSDVGSVNAILDFLNGMYRLKRCNLQSFPDDFRPCLYYHMEQCAGICLPEADAAKRDAERARYRREVDEILSILDGKNKDLIRRMTEEMECAAADLRFEDAARLRDRIHSIKTIAEKQRITLKGPAEMDIVLTAESQSRRYGIVFFVRKGKLSGRDSFPIGSDVPGEGADLTASFLKQYYADNLTIPREVLTDSELPDRVLLESWLSELRGSHVKITDPKRGEKRALLGLARRDVVQMLHYLDEKVANEEEKARGYSRLLQRVLDAVAAAHAGDGAASVGAGAAPMEGAASVGAGAPSMEGEANFVKGDVPFSESGAQRTAACLNAPGPAAAPLLPETGMRIEAYDISHLAGTDTVGGMVVFRDGKPLKKEYRKFRIRGETAGDDEAALQEVLYRRLRRALAGDPGFRVLPNLFLIDGAAGQVGAVKQVLTALDASTHGASALSAIPVIGMVKDDHHRTRALLFEGIEFPLEEEPLLFHFIGAIQEEVHRFSIEYQRSLRGKNMAHSLLDEAPGIGEKRRNALLLRFGTIDRIREASLEDLSKTPGMNERAATSLRAYLQDHPSRT